MHNEPKLTKWERRTRPASPVEAWGFAVVGFCMSGCAALGLAMAYQYGNVLWLTLTVAGVGGLAVLHGRILAHDERAYTLVQEYAQEAPAAHHPGPLIQPWYVEKRGSGGIMKRGGLRLSEQQWRVVAGQVLANERLTRAVLEECNRICDPHKPFPNVTDRFQEYRHEFVTMGWVDEQGGITLFGRESLSQFLTPPIGSQPPHPGTYQPNFNGRPPTTTDDDCYRPE